MTEEDGDLFTCVDNSDSENEDQTTIKEEIQIETKIKQEAIVDDDEATILIEQVTSLNREEPLLVDDSADGAFESLFPMADEIEMPGNSSVAEKPNSESNVCEGEYCIDLNEEYEGIVNLEEKTCIVCKKKFTTKHKLRHHLAVIHLFYSRYKCKFCNFKANLVSVCRKHALKVHQKEVTWSTNFFSCFCSLNVRTPGINKQRRRLQLRLKPAAVGDATKAESTDGPTGEEDRPKCINVNSLSCSFCGSVFAFKSSLKRHLAVFHFGCKTYKCRLCDFQGNLLKELREHLNAAHKDECGGKNVKDFLIRNNFHKMEFLEVPE